MMCSIHRKLFTVPLQILVWLSSGLSDSKLALGLKSLRAIGPQRGVFRRFEVILSGFKLLGLSANLQLKQDYESFSLFCLSYCEQIHRYNKILDITNIYGAFTSLPPPCTKF